MDVSPIRDSSKDVIESGALRLTWGSGVGAVIVGLGTAIDPVFDTVVGENASPAVRASILIAAIGAWAVIATGDLLARSYATAHTKKAGLHATLTRGVDEAGFTAVDFRASPSDPTVIEVLLVKAGKKPEWVSTEHVRFD